MIEIVKVICEAATEMVTSIVIGWFAVAFVKELFGLFRSGRR